MKKKSAKQKPPRKWISIDPGLSQGGGGTGMAAWVVDKLANAEVIRSDFDEWEERAFDIARWVRVQLSYSSPDLVLIEQPQYFGTDKGNQAMKDGSIGKLHHLVGAISQEARSFDTKVQLVPVSKWLGQTPKPVLQARVERATGRVFRSHDLYAVGLGLWYLKGCT